MGGISMGGMAEINEYFDLWSISILRIINMYVI
jgi:hypothetical protein